ncbi:hypothetical protein EDC04DRAFT_2611642 [Pisolithus marmoratus]|nr:hypothetical protein EDC04DRAFT_2611642 [Pisolithus marmoratus]
MKVDVLALLDMFPPTVLTITVHSSGQRHNLLEMHGSNMGKSVVSKLDLTVACETMHIMLQCSTSTSINPYYPMNITWKTRSSESKDGHGATNIDQHSKGRDSIDSAALRTTSPKCFTVQDSTSSSGEASQPSAGHAPLIMNDTYMVLKNHNLWQVSPQKLNKFRDTTGSFHWFRSEGNDPLSFLPSHIEDVTEGDLFFYWVKSAGKCQMWIWRSVGGMTAWVPVQEGEQILGGDGNMRYLVVTDGRQPSLVQAVTWERRYRKRQALVTLS